MVLTMTANHSNVLLPMAMPTRNELRHALASVTHRELANMAQDLRAAQRVINGLLARAERLGIAA